MRQMQMRVVLLSFLAGLLLGCSAYRHGYYSQQALNRYLYVDAQTQTFGYKYLGYIEGFRAPIKKFVHDNGVPDFIYPYKQGKREGVILFYYDRDKAYDFFEANWQPDSVYVRAFRSLNAGERAIYKELLERAGKLPPKQPAQNPATPNEA